MMNNKIKDKTQYGWKKKQLSYLNGVANITTDVCEEAEAQINPLDPQKGSATTTSFGIYKDYNLIQGHMINAQIGGPGIAENFFPLTKSQNSRHSSTVETPLKAFVTDLGQKQTTTGGDWLNRRIGYHVKAIPKSWNWSNSNDALDTELECQIFYVGSNGKEMSSLPKLNLSVVDKSSPKAGSTTLDSILSAVGFGQSGVGSDSGRFSLGSPTLVLGKNATEIKSNGTTIGYLFT